MPCTLCQEKQFLVRNTFRSDVQLYNWYIINKNIVTSGTGRAENGCSEQSGAGGGHPSDSQDGRVVFVNAPQPAIYRNNHISTAKYSVLSFVPSFLFEQFRRYSNCFFLFIALMQVNLLQYFISTFREIKWLFLPNIQCSGIQYFSLVSPYCILHWYDYFRKIVRFFFN